MVTVYWNLSKVASNSDRRSDMSAGKINSVSVKLMKLRSRAFLLASEEFLH